MASSLWKEGTASYYVLLNETNNTHQKPKTKPKKKKKKMIARKMMIKVSFNFFCQTLH